MSITFTAPGTAPKSPGGAKPVAPGGMGSGGKKPDAKPSFKMQQRKRLEDQKKKIDDKLKRIPVTSFIRHIAEIITAAEVSPIYLIEEIKDVLKKLKIYNMVDKPKTELTTQTDKKGNTLFKVVLRGNAKLEDPQTANMKTVKGFYSIELDPQSKKINVFVWGKHEPPMVDQK